MKIDVLDKGYVRLVDHLGSDVSIVNAARVSFDRESTEFSDGDAKLLRYLATHNHTSPFRHAFVSLELYAPLMVCRQLWKYAVASSHLEDGSAHNESSRRYITENTEFMGVGPTEWRTAPENKKQGSGPVLVGEQGERFTALLELCQKTCENFYDQALKAGICAEQARLFLPAYGLYVRWRWAGSLAMFLHVIKERTGHDAQGETQQYGKAIASIVKELYPNVYETVIG